MFFGKHVRLFTDTPATFTNIEISPCFCASSIKLRIDEREDKSISIGSTSNPALFIVWAIIAALFILFFSLKRLPSRKQDIALEVQELLKLYAAHPQVTALDTLLKNDTSRNIFLKGLNGSGPAMTIASLFTKGRGSYVCVLNDQEEAGYFYHDLMQLTASNEVYFFPEGHQVRACRSGERDPAHRGTQPVARPGRLFRNRHVSGRLGGTSRGPGGIEGEYLKDQRGREAG